MNRLPYGAYQTMTEEEKREHRRELCARYRAEHRKELNAKNKAFMELWKRTKPFVIPCTLCGQSFNAVRRDRKLCPACHAKAHERAQDIKDRIEARRIAKANLKEAVVSMHENGCLQRDIAQELGVSQRSVSHILLSQGIRSLKYHKRKNKN